MTSAQCNRKSKNNERKRLGRSKRTVQEGRFSEAGNVRRPGVQALGTHGVYLMPFPNINCVAIENYFPMIQLYSHFITPKEIIDLGSGHQ